MGAHSDHSGNIDVVLIVQMTVHASGNSPDPCAVRRGHANALKAARAVRACSTKCEYIDQIERAFRFELQFRTLLKFDRVIFDSTMIGP